MESAPTFYRILHNIFIVTFHRNLAPEINRLTPLPPVNNSSLPQLFSAFPLSHTQIILSPETFLQWIFPFPLKYKLKVCLVPRLPPPSRVTKKLIEVRWLVGIYWAFFQTDFTSSNTLMGKSQSMTGFSSHLPKLPRGRSIPPPPQSLDVYWGGGGGIPGQMGHQNCKRGWKSFYLFHVYFKAKEGLDHMQGPN